MQKKFIFILTVVSLLLLSGCATQANKDPLESMNRGIYKFNDVTDKALLKPVATAYTKVTPSPIRTGISNFFNNLFSVTTILNDLLQLKFTQAFTDTGRFVINSTFGLAGFIDVAGMDGIPNHQEDFGQTLAVWGIHDGAYLVLPFFGPSTLRDTTGFLVDSMTTDPVNYLHNIGEIRTSNQLRGANLINIRSQLLDAGDLIDQASLDPYAFMRDAYLQRRSAMISEQSPQAKTSDSNDDFGDYDKAFE